MFLMNFYECRYEKKQLTEHNRVMSSVKDYFTGLGKGMVSLLKGMEVTGMEFVTKKVTEEYPDNRDNLPVGERFRGTLELIYDEKGNHKCIACGLCQMNCPNQTIHIESKMVELPDGKKKKVLVKYLYDLGSCTFCQMCVSACPHHAIHFTNKFEHAVYTRSKLVKQLNYLPEKDPVEVWKAQQKAKEEAAAKAAEAKAAEAPKNETTEKN